MRVIGLTGNFGTGKTTVSQFLTGLGAVTIDADGLGHELLLPDRRAYHELISAFGTGILKGNQSIDRQKLAEIAFRDKAAQNRLNEIMHPKIYELALEKIEQFKKQGHRVVVLEAALLIEAGWKKPPVDQVWITVAPREVIVNRLTKNRNFTEEEISARLNKQMPSEEKMKQADVVIDTNCSLEELKARVTELWQKL
jgi:dephospho-CoA kinase